MTTVRADRATLRSPVRLDAGAVRYDAVLTTAGTTLTYSWGSETVDRAALADAAYMDALRGTPVILDPSLHWDGIQVDGEGRAIVGTVTQVRMDGDAQVGELTLHRADAIAWVERHKARGDSPGVSVRYDVAEIDNGVQRRRKAPNHVLLTLTPRDTTARIRADDERTDMEIAELAAKVDTLAQTLTGLGGKVDGIASTLTERADSAPTPPDARARTLAVEKIARIKGIELCADDDLETCESKVVEALGLRADAVSNAGVYLVGVASVIPEEAPATKRADGMNGKRVPAPDTADVHDSADALDLIANVGG